MITYPFVEHRATIILGGHVEHQSVVTREVTEVLYTISVPPIIRFPVGAVVTGSVLCGSVRIIRADTKALVRIFGDLESDLPACLVTSRQINSPIDEDEMFTVLGHESQLSLGQLIYLLGLQTHGQEGALSIGEQPTVLYRNCGDTRYAILVLWEEDQLGGGGWHIRVYDPTNTDESLYAGTRILSALP